MGNRLPLVRMGWRVIPLLEHLEADEVAQILGLSQVNFGMYQNTLFMNLVHDQKRGCLMNNYRTAQCLKHVNAFDQALRERLTDLLGRSYAGLHKGP